MRRGLRLLWRWRRWVLPALGGLGLFVLLGPVLGVVAEAARLGGALLLTPGGRLVLVNVLLLVLLWRLRRRLRRRWRRRAAARAAGRFVAGVRAALAGDWTRAGRAYAAAARWAALGGGENADLPELPALAGVERARALYHQGRLDAALREAEVRGGGGEPGWVRARRLEVRALVYAGHPRLEPASVRREVAAALKARRTPALLRAALALAVRAGEEERALAHHEELVEVLAGRDREVEGLRLRERACRFAAALLRAGRPAAAAAVLDRVEARVGPSEAAALLRGDAALAAGRPEEALRAWARFLGPEARVRAARVLAAAADPTRVLAACPHPDLFLDLARRELRAGGTARAGRAVRAGRAAGADPAETAFLAGEVCAAAGDRAGAAAAYGQALRCLFGLAPAVGSRRAEG